MDFLTNLNWNSPSWDLFIILFFVAAFLLYGLSLGRDRLVVIMVGLYMALAIVNTAPYFDFLNGYQANFSVNNISILKITLFFGLFVVIFFLISRSALMNTIGAGSSQGSWWQTLIFSFLQVGLMISVVLSYLPKEFIAKLSGQMQNFFISDPARFCWLVGPVLMMALVRKRKPTSAPEY
jgi:hypothetical protein